MHVIKHLSKPIEYTKLWVNPSVNYGLWVIMMCGFIFGKKYIDNIQESDVHYGEVYSCAGRGIWEISLPSILFVNLKLI